MAQNEVIVDFMSFAFIIAVNLGQLREIFDVLGSLQLAKTRETPLEAARNYLEATLKVSAQTRDSE